MGHQLHTPLPRGAQLELLNVRVEIGRRESDEAESDYIMTFKDQDGDLTVYVPLSPASFRSFVEGMTAALSGIVTPPKPEIVRAMTVPRGTPHRNGA